jgi:hypothetical protein
MEVCKLCDRERKLIKAHIIPKSFWEIDSYKPLTMLTNTAGEYPRRSRIGVYDNTIVCASCEQKFGDYDSYAAEILLNDSNKLKKIRDATGTVVGRAIDNVNCRKLKLFCIALLWRAGMSTHSYYRKVQLGTFADHARDLLLRADPGCPETFGTIFAMWNDLAWPLHMDPFPERWDGIKYHRFYLGKYVVYIKVDRRSTSKTFSPFLLSSGQPLIIIARHLQRSKELPLIKKIARLNTGRFPIG